MLDIQHPAPNIAIEIRDLTVSFGDRPILDAFNLRVNCGEKVALTGPSGTGKSTVLKCLLGLAVPRAGSISILGRTVDAHTVWETRRRLAYVAQEPDLGSGTVRQTLERPFAYKVNVTLSGNLERLPGLLNRFNLQPELLEKRVDTLSGGEKQRVALVSAILLERPIILLDEASSALDKTNKQAVADFLGQAGDVTVLSVSHDTGWLGFSSRVVDIAGREDAGRGQS